MTAKGAHSGEYVIILEWFTLNPEVFMTPLDIAEEFGITRIKAANALGHLTRTNKIVRENNPNGRGSHYRFRNETEKREEFKIARPIPEKPKASVMRLPMLIELDPNMLTWYTKSVLNKQFSTAAQHGRVQYLNTNEFIVWNSREQREKMRQMALGH